MGSAVLSSRFCMTQLYIISFHQKKNLFFFQYASVKHALGNNNKAVRDAKTQNQALM